MKRETAFHVVSHYMLSEGYTLSEVEPNELKEIYETLHGTLKTNITDTLVQLVHTNTKTKRTEIVYEKLLSDFGEYDFRNNITAVTVKAPPKRDKTSLTIFALHAISKGYDSVKIKKTLRGYRVTLRKDEVTIQSIVPDPYAHTRQILEAITSNPKNYKTSSQNKSKIKER